MKKNFFKKLSFVMALAMIVTALAPAAGVFAAAAPKLNAKTVYIHVAEKTTEFDFNVANKKDGWKYSWKSSNEDVAEVASNGLVTAVGKGTATVSVVIKDKNGEKVDTLKATVVVRDNIKKLTITNAVEKLAVGATNDFNRSFVTVSGNSKVTSGITRWEVDKAGATIVANSGLFTATEAGTYTVTARAFQSTAKYNSWLSDKTKYASYVTASATATVKVAASLVKATQVDLNTVKVTFDSAVTDAATKLTVAQVISGTDVVLGINKVTMSADNKEATIDMNSNFTDKYTYKVSYPELGTKEFVAAISDDVTLVTSLAVTTKTVQNSRPTTVGVALYNKDGVNLAEGTADNNNLLARVTMETSSNNSSISGRTLYLYTVGTTTTVKATYHSYTYDTTGNETGLITGSGVITCVAYSDFLDGTVNVYDIAKSIENPDFVSTNHSVAAGDNGYQLYVKLKGKDASNNDVYKTNKSSDANYDSNIKFTSGNTNVLIIDETTGLLSPVAAGTVNVVVKHGDNVVGSVAVTVKAKRTVTEVTLSSTSITLSNISAAADTATLYVNVKDQMGDYMTPGTDFNTDFYYSSTNQDTNLHTGWDVSGAAASFHNQGKVVFRGANGATPVAAGTYSFAVKITDKTTWVSRVVYCTVTVKSTTNLTVTSYKIETDNTNYDMMLDKATGNTDEIVKFNVYGYSSDNVRLVKIPVAATAPGATANDFYVQLTRNGGSPIAYTIVSGEGQFNLTPADAIVAPATSSAISKKDQGTYQLTLKDGTNAVKYNTYFTVADTQAKPTYKVADTTVTGSVNTTTPTAASNIAVAKAALDVTLDGYSMDDSIVSATITGYGSTFNISKIVVREFIKDYNATGPVYGTYIDHTIDVVATVTVTP